MERPLAHTGAGGFCVPGNPPRAVVEQVVECVAAMAGVACPLPGCAGSRGDGTPRRSRFSLPRLRASVLRTEPSPSRKSPQQLRLASSVPRGAEGARRRYLLSRI
jgi:hypothetical protein